MGYATVDESYGIDGTIPGGCRLYEATSQPTLGPLVPSGASQNQNKEHKRMWCSPLVTPPPKEWECEPGTGGNDWDASLPDRMSKTQCASQCALNSFCKQFDYATVDESYGIDGTIPGGCRLYEATSQPTLGPLVPSSASQNQNEEHKRMWCAPWVTAPSPSPSLATPSPSPSTASGDEEALGDETLQSVS